MINKDFITYNVSPGHKRKAKGCFWWAVALFLGFLAVAEMAVWELMR